MKNILFIVTVFGISSIASAQKKSGSVKSHLKKDISFLASDEMQGRLAGSPEDKKSAEYIATGFKQAGLIPFKESYLHSFDVVKLRIAGNCKFLLFASDNAMPVSLSLHSDFYPISESAANDSVSAAIINLGYGIEASAEGHNDFANPDKIKGKIAMMRIGFPMDDSLPHGKLAPYSEVSQKIANALKYGAAGIIFLPGSHSASVPAGDLQRNMEGLSIPVFYSKKELNVASEARATMISKIATLKGSAYNATGFRDNKAKNTIIICAHHDHLGHNEYNNSTYKGPTAIHNGADDNASGVAAMLELARTLKGGKYKKNNYLFIAFSGEELGLLGSKFFVKNMLPTDINYVINIDMLGRLDSTNRTLIINGTGTSPQWKTTLSTLKTDTNKIKFVTSESGLGPSDHASFYMENIPVLHFFSGQHYDYHKPSDDEEKINYEGMVQSLNVIQQVVAKNNKSGKLAFTKTKDEQPGRRSFKVTLGIMPDYTYTGKGLLIDGVTEGKPAQKAGIQRKDIVTKMGNYPIVSIQDYIQALSHFEKGQKIAVEVLRAGETKILEVEL